MGPFCARYLWNWNVDLGGVDYISGLFVKKTFKGINAWND